MFDPREYFGAIDIYLFDQIMKDRFRSARTVLDAGCGGGRNLVYFLRHGFEVVGVDVNPDAVDECRRLAAYLGNEAARFEVAPIEDLPFEDAVFDVVIASAVLHFASNHEHFSAMIDELWRVLKPGGVFFARLASDIGLPGGLTPLGDGRFLLPDGSERFVVSEQMIGELIGRLGGGLLEPIKTTNVQNLRAMTTLVLTNGVDFTGVQP